MTAFLVDYSGEEQLGLLAPCKLATVEITRELSDIAGLDGYQTVYAVYLDQGTPVGTSILPVHSGYCRARDLASGMNSHTDRINRLRSRRDLEKKGRRVHKPGAGHANASAKEANPTAQAASIIIPTRDRPDHLEPCLDALRDALNADIQVIVVDSAPRDGGVRQLVEEKLAGAEYLRLDEPGTSRARNAGAARARNDLLVFLDDDTRILPGCIDNLVAAFRLHPAVDAVTGLVLPDDMETTAQAKFEAVAGFGRGVERRWFVHTEVDPEATSLPQRLSDLGVGACCAVRRSAFDSVGGFSTTMGPGEQYDSGEDIDLFARLVVAGGILVYEPAAMVCHRHRRSLPAAESQLVSAAAGAAKLHRFLASDPGTLGKAASRSMRRQLLQSLKTALKASWQPREFSPGVYWRYCRELLLGYYLGPGGSPGAVRFAPAESPRIDTVTMRDPVVPDRADGALDILRVDLDRDIDAYRVRRGFAGIECHVFRGMRFLGRFRLPAVAGIVSRAQILDAVAAELPPGLFRDGLSNLTLEKSVLTPVDARNAMTWRASRFRPAVSVVIPTCDRPADLDNCLAAIARQDYDGPLEVLVVDNNPSSGKTRPVVDRYDCCRYLGETKRGAAAARNTGFRAAVGEIIAVTDDDVRVPPTWIRQLVEPFWREDIWMVTGTILPKRLEEIAERKFEEYGGFRFFDQVVEAGPRWFRGTGSIAPPVWQLGTSANMAFRRRIVDDEAIGPMREFLGPGTVCGAGEDLYFTYRLLKEGHTLRFDPSIWVYHCHRQDMERFRHQAFSYGKSAVSHHLHIAIADGDFRGLRMVFWDMPKYQLLRLTGFKHRTPGGFWPEVRGQLTGLIAYFVSRWKDRNIERARKRINGEIGG